MKISANGVDAVEGNESNKIKLMQSNNISVSNSSNVVVGDNNQITINRHISELENFIDCSSGTPEQKAEAKGLLRRFAEHPLLAAVISGAIGTFASKL